MISIMDFRKFVEVVSGSKLFLLFNLLRASFIISEVMFAKTFRSQ